MIQEQALDEVYRAIGTGVLADKAIIALARFQKLGPEGLSDADWKSLALAQQYLVNASEGYAVIDKKPLSNRSLERALALGETTEAAALRLGATKRDLQERFAEYLRGLAQVLDAIRERNNPSAEEIEELRDFLGSLSRHTLNKVAAKIMPDVRLEGNQW